MIHEWSVVVVDFFKPSFGTIMLKIVLVAVN